MLIHESDRNVPARYPENGLGAPLFAPKNGRPVRQGGASVERLEGRRLLSAVAGIGAAAGTEGSSAASRVATRSASVTGVVFDDANADGKREAAEKGVGQWRVFADTNRNGRFDGGEPCATTDSSGRYALHLASGRYVIGVRLRTGYDPTSPRSTWYDVVLGAGKIVAHADFGVVATPAAPAAFRPLQALQALAIANIATASGIFIKAAGIVGDSTDPLHKGEIAGTSVTAGITSDEVFRSLDIGRTATVTKPVDQTTAAFFRLVGSGGTVSSLVVSLTKIVAGHEVNFLTFTFTTLNQYCPVKIHRMEVWPGYLR